MVSFIFVIGHSIKKSFFCVFLLPKLILSIFLDFKTVLNVPKYYYHSRYYEEVFKSNTSFYIKVKKRLTLSFCMCFLLVNVGVSTWTDRLVNEVRKITASATFFNLVPRGPTPFIHFRAGLDNTHQDWFRLEIGKNHCTSQFQRKTFVGTYTENRE